MGLLLQEERCLSYEEILQTKKKRKAQGKKKN